MKRNLGIIALTLAVTVVALPGDLLAQHDARSLAMGEAYTAVARGLSSSFYNPANLGLSDGPAAEFKLFSFGVGLNNNSFVYSDYDKYNGKHLTESDKEAILNSIPEEGLNLKAFTGAEALSFAYRCFAFNLSGWGDADLYLPKDPVELALYGNALKSNVELDDARGESCALASATLSGGFPLLRSEKLEVAVGAGFHYLYGIAYGEILEVEGEAITTDTSLSAHGEIQMRTALGGQGYSADLGLAMRYNKRWTFGFSILRMLENVNWNRDTEKRVYWFEVEPLNAETIDDDSVATSDDSTFTIDDFSTRRPTVVRTGVAYQASRLLCSMDLTSASKNGVGRSGTNFGLGFEYRLIDWLPLRMGFSVGSYYGNFSSYGCGFDFGRFSFDFALANFGSLLPKDTKGLGISLSNCMRF
jgi:hypothetical protein